MEYEQKAYQKLKSVHQQQLLGGWDRFTESQKDVLLSQIQQLDTAVLQAQLNSLKAPSLQSILPFDVFDDYSLSGNREDVEKGKKLIAESRMGCLIVAGGQGTRLGFNGPKGMFPITPIKHKTLYQLFAEKTLAAGKQAGRALPLAIMTSPLNHEETIRYFQKNHFFGLHPGQIAFFSQQMLPFLNDKSDLLLDRNGVIAQGPDGNGSALAHFFRSGIWTRWKGQGVTHVNFVVIDNPLADPFDAELLGHQIRYSADVVVKCTIRENPSEKVGILVKREGKVDVIEYTEIPDEERLAVNPDGRLRHRCANLSLFCFSMDFIQLAAEFDSQMPLHKAYKSLDAGSDRKAWKFEKFIFDTLPFAQNVRALLYPREECFAPLKNFEGEDSIQTVQQALLNRDKHVFSKVANGSLPEQPFEVAQDFYYPTLELKRKYKHHFSSINTYFD